jgi:hypothetical protein
MKKYLSSFVALLVITIALNAQDCTFYFPSKPGTITEIKTYDGKDKLTASTKTKILESSATSVKFNSEVFDSKGKSLTKGDMEIKCANGEMVIDMKSYLKGLDMDKFKNMEMSFETKDMTLPAKLQAGQKLNDGEITIKISNQGMKIMTISIKITNRTVVAMEDVTTPAGTFKCAKITSDIENKTMFTIKSKMTEWIAAKTGTVRSESRDQKNKLQTYSVLTSLKE